MKKILIVEDEAIVAKDIKQKLSAAGFHVTGIAKSYDRALRIFRENIPDLILCDIYLKSEKTGIDFIERIKRITPVPVIYLTAYSDDDTVNKALKTHPSSYLVKPFTKRQLLVTIDRVLQQDANEIDRTKTRVPYPTPRELEILAFLAQGNTTLKIAEILEVSPETIHTHRKNLLRKYKVSTTPQLIAIASREKWLNL